MITIKITVTKEIIMRSRPNEPNGCAFATAVRDILPKAAVMDDRIFPFGRTDEEMKEHFPITDEMAEFIQAFDKTTDLSATADQLGDREFEVEVPDWVVDRIDIEDVRKFLENHPNLAVVE